VGTGDGRLPWLWAREDAARLFIGVDASASGLREFSGRALREGLENALFVRAAVESLPRELAGLADRLTVVLPWGSLLTAVARPSVPGLEEMRRVCRPGARITVVLGSEPVRDRAELARLAIPPSSPVDRARDVASGYADAGFALAGIREMDGAELTRWPSTWARRLSHAGGRRFWLLEGTADGEPR
jgi:hypothetical protein